MSDFAILHSCLTSPAIKLTMKVTLSALVLQLVTGVPLGLYIACARSRLSRCVDVLATLPMIFPPMALGFFLLCILGRTGFLGGFLLQRFHLKVIFTFWGLLIAVYLIGLPFMAKAIQAARQQLDEALVEAAATLGKSHWQILFRVVLPNIKSGIAAGLLLAFGRSIGEVGISLMLGGNIIGRTETLSLAIYNAVFDGELLKAGIYSAILSAMTIVMLILVSVINRRRDRVMAKGLWGRLRCGQSLE